MNDAHRAGADTRSDRTAARKNFPALFQHVGLVDVVVTLRHYGLGPRLNDIKKTGFAVFGHSISIGRSVPALAE